MHFMLNSLIFCSILAAEMEKSQKNKESNGMNNYLNEAQKANFSHTSVYPSIQ